MNYLHALEQKLPSTSGYIYAVFAHFCFSLADLFIRQSRSISHFQAFHTAATGVSVMVFFILIGQNQPFTTKSPRINRFLILIGLLNVIGGICVFYGFQQVPLSEGVVVLQSIPVITSILAFFFLGEKYDILQLFSAIFCTVGVIFIIKPSFLFPNDFYIAGMVEYDKFQGILSILVASFAFSFQSIAIKKAVTQIPPILSTFYIVVIPALFVSVLQIINNSAKALTLNEWLILCGNMTAGCIAQIFFNRAFKFGDAGKVMLIGYLQIFFAYILDIFVLGSTIDFYSMIGASLIFSCVFLRLYKALKSG